MKKEEIAFRRLLRELIRSYVSKHIDDFLKGNIEIYDDGEVIRIYRLNQKPNYYDIGIVY